MNNFASEIEGTPWEDDFQDRMQIVIANKVNPQIEELRKKLRLSSSSFIAQLWDIARKNVGLTMATTVCFPDWATQAVIVGGAATIAEAFGKERSNRKDAEKNGLSLLMKVR